MWTVGILKVDSCLVNRSYNKTNISDQIEILFLSGPFHLIKLLFFFYPTNVNWQLDQTKKKKTTAQPRRGSNSGLPIVSSHLSDRKKKGVWLNISELNVKSSFSWTYPTEVRACETWFAKQAGRSLTWVHNHEGLDAVSQLHGLSCASTRFAVEKTTRTSQTVRMAGSRSTISVERGNYFPLERVYPLKVNLEIESNDESVKQREHKSNCRRNLMGRK